MSRPETLREELLEARERLQRQIEVLDAGPSYVPTPELSVGHREFAERLRDLLDEIDQALESER